MLREYPMLRINQANQLIQHHQRIQWNFIFNQVFNDLLYSSAVTDSKMKMAQSIRGANGVYKPIPVI
jgi:hypothetical protein